jgi:hypothetical protein
MKRSRTIFVQPGLNVIKNVTKKWSKTISYNVIFKGGDRVVGPGARRLQLHQNYMDSFLQRCLLVIA